MREQSPVSVYGSPTPGLLFLGPPITLTLQQPAGYLCSAPSLSQGMGRLDFSQSCQSIPGLSGLVLLSPAAQAPGQAASGEMTLSRGRPAACPVGRKPQATA